MEVIAIGLILVLCVVFPPLALLVAAVVIAEAMMKRW